MLSREEIASVLEAVRRYIGMNNFISAIVTIDDLIHTDPQNMQFYLIRGVTYYLYHQHVQRNSHYLSNSNEYLDMAIASFKNVLDNTDPSSIVYGKACKGLAVICHCGQNLDKAIQFYEKANLAGVAYAQDYADACYDKALYLCVDKNWIEAIPYFDKAYQYGTMYPRQLENYQNCLLNQVITLYEKFRDPYKIGQIHPVLEVIQLIVKADSILPLDEHIDKEFWKNVIPYFEVAYQYNKLDEKPLKVYQDCLLNLASILSSEIANPAQSEDLKIIREAFQILSQADAVLPEDEQVAEKRANTCYQLAKMCFDFAEYADSLYYFNKLTWLVNMEEDGLNEIKAEMHNAMSSALDKNNLAKKNNLVQLNFDGGANNTDFIKFMDLLVTANSESKKSFNDKVIIADFSNCSIDDDGIEEFTALFAKLPPCFRNLSINLFNNPLTVNGHGFLAEAIQNNKYPRGLELKLSCNTEESLTVITNVMDAQSPDLNMMFPANLITHFHDILVKGKYPKNFTITLTNPFQLSEMECIQSLCATLKAMSQNIYKPVQIEICWDIQEQSLKLLAESFRHSTCVTSLLCQTVPVSESASQNTKKWQKDIDNCCLRNQLLSHYHQKHKPDWIYYIKKKSQEAEYYIPNPCFGTAIPSLKLLAGSIFTDNPNKDYLTKFPGELPAEIEKYIGKLEALKTIINIPCQLGSKVD